MIETFFKNKCCSYFIKGRRNNFPIDLLFATYKGSCSNMFSRISILNMLQLPTSITVWESLVKLQTVAITDQARDLLQVLSQEFRKVIRKQWSICRSSRPEVFLKKDVLKICRKFRGEHPCWRVKCSIIDFFTEPYIPAVIYLLKVNNKNTRARCQICSKSTIKTPEQRK